MGLNVAMLAAEKFFKSVPSEIFRHIDKFAAAVIALSGQSLRIFIRQMRTGRGHDRGRNDIFAGNQFDIVLLAFEFRVHRGIQLRVGLFDDGHIDHGKHLSFLSCFPL